jgi:hypothetical protein
MITDWATMTTSIAIVGWIIPFVMLFIMPANRKPSSATAWLLLVFLLPYLGVLLFLLLGSPKLSRRQRTGQRTMDDFINRAVVEARKRPEQASLLDPPIAPRHEAFVKLNTNLGDLPALGGNAVELFQLNLEVTLMCYDPQVVVNLRQIEADYLCKSKPVNLDQWETRPVGEKFFENISRLTAALQ